MCTYIKPSCVPFISHNFLCQSYFSKAEKNKNKKDKKDQEKLKNLAFLIEGISMRHDGNELPIEKYLQGEKWKVSR